MGYVELKGVNLIVVMFQSPDILNTTFWVKVAIFLPPKYINNYNTK